MARERKNRRGAAAKVAGSRHGPLPPFVAPCLALRQQAPPTGDAWVHEIKFDGYRLEARLDHGVVRLLTRNNQEWTKRFPLVAKALAALNVETALLDGEVVVEREDGTTSFTDLVDDLKSGTSARMTYYAFDLLYCDGVDLRGATLIERKAALARILRGRRAGVIRFSKHIDGDGALMLKHACELGLEGIISKRADRPYRSGRTGDWIKATCLLNDEFVVCGYLDSTAQKHAVGALVLGKYVRRDLAYVGRVGTGFTRAKAAELWQIMQPLRQPSPPFAESLDAAQSKGVVWLRPRLVAQVEYRALTGDGLLRHAAFKGLREDKRPRQIR
jgi:bifunctional non-homologous end joining protein LigD